jgi:tetratricopeptide (TPR) repeat protein
VRLFAAAAIALFVTLGGDPAMAQSGSPQEASLLSRGEDAYLNDKPEDAVALLSQAVQEQPENARIYHYLGVAHQQLGNHERAVEVMREGVTKNAAPELRASLYLNIGNSLYQLGDLGGAREAYAQAIGLRNSFARPYLNRANTIVASYKEVEQGQEKLQAFEQAIADYRRYLSLNPNTGQRTRIERMISLLQQDVDDTKERIAEQRRREQEERERRQRLVDSVLNSLDSAEQESQSMSAGQENIEEYEEDLDIAD